MHDLKYKIYFYTEGEFLEMLEEIVNATSKDKSLKGKKLEKYLDTLVDHFIKITEHPKKGDLIFYPNSPEDGKPENRICHLKIITFWLSDDFRYEKVTVAIAVIISNVKRKHR